MTSRAPTHLPDPLRAAIEQARVMLASERAGDLPLALRRRLWAALGPLDTEGRKRRARLAIASARHVLPAWDAAYPGDGTPERLLALAEAVIAGSADEVSCARYRALALSHFDSLSSLAAAPIVVAAGYAAAQALAAALFDEAFDPERIDPAVSDNELDPMERDASYLAAVVSAGGPPWHSSTSAARRRAFWEWWLHEAVPAAWSADETTER